MAWVWIAAAVFVIAALIVYVRGRRQKAALAEFRTHFPRIARLRLVAACQSLAEGQADRANPST